MSDNICPDCYATILEINHFDEYEECLRFLRSHGLIQERNCTRCGEKANLTKIRQKYYWRRRRTKKEVDNDGNEIIFKCDFLKSIFSETWLAKAKVPLKSIFILAKLYLQRNFCAIQAGEMLGLNKNTITDWLNFIREVIGHYFNETPIMIGGENVVVEIDECKIGRRKNHKGRIVDGQWVFGGVESKNKSRCFLVAVEDRSTETLKRIIEEKLHLEP